MNPEQAELARAAVKEAKLEGVVSVITGPSTLLPRHLLFIPISQYLLEAAFGVWALECGVLASRPAPQQTLSSCAALALLNATGQCRVTLSRW